MRVRNGKTLVTDGPFAEAKEMVAGFYLIDAPPLAVVELFLGSELAAQLTQALAALEPSFASDHPLFGLPQPSVALVATPLEVTTHRLEHVRRIDPARVQGARPELRGEADVQIPR